MMAEKNWDEVVRRVVPVAVPVSVDDENLDYSIAVEYDGPPISFEVPKIQPLDPHSLSSYHRVSDSRGPSKTTASRVKKSISSVSNGRSNQASEVVHRDGERNSPSLVASTSGEKEEDYDYGVRKEEEEEDREHSSPQRADGKKSAAVTSTSTEDGREDDYDRKGKRPIEVKFCSGKYEREGNYEDEEEVEEEETPYSAPSSSIVSEAESRPKKERKKGACSRCKRTNVWKEREACLVCDNRYCSSCLLKIMGSMPEGRKCVSCIGLPIDESKRATLGKASRMLSRVVSPLEVKQIMKAEKECSANQLRPEQLIVNGKKLTHDQLDELLGCPNPPSKLKPGRYWYDKDSGLWGKVIFSS